MRLSKRRKGQTMSDFDYETGGRHMIYNILIIFGFIILISIIGGIAFGQVPILPIGMGGSEIDTVEYIFSGEANWNTKELTDIKIINRPITLSDLFDYAEECYNDSTWGHKDAISIIEPEYYVYRLDSDYINNKICYLRKRVTLQGFTEWYREKQ